MTAGEAKWITENKQEFLNEIRNIDREIFVSCMQGKTSYIEDNINGTSIQEFYIGKGYKVMLHGSGIEISWGTLESDLGSPFKLRK